MRIPQKDEICEQFSPYHYLIVTIIQTAWNQYRALLVKSPVTLPRTRANLVWDWAITIARHEFADTDIKILDVNQQTTWFYITQDVMFRIKKSDKDGFTSNYPTQSATDFYEQDAELDGIQQAIRLDVTYILDSTEMAIQDIRVVYRNGNRVEWQYSILEEVTSITDMPINKSAELQRSKVKVKQTKEQQQTTSDTVDK